MGKIDIEKPGHGIDVIGELEDGILHKPSGDMFDPESVLERSRNVDVDPEKYFCLIKPKTEDRS